MKILVFGPRDRYDVYRPPFADEMPVELVFRRPDQTYVQAAPGKCGREDHFCGCHHGCGSRCDGPASRAEDDPL